MPAIETSIWIALKSRIDTIVTNPAIMVIEPNATFTPPSDALGPAPFILVSDSRNEVERIGIDARLHAYSGTLLLAVHWPVSRPATHTQLMQIAGEIAEYFPADQCMSYGGVRLRVQKKAYAEEPRRDEVQPYRISLVRVMWATY